MSTGGARAARQQLSRAGEVKVSAADALRAALFPPEAEDDGPSVVAQLADHVQNFEKEWQAQKEAEAEAERYDSLTAAQRLAMAIAGHSAAMPLNGPGVLNALASGLGQGATINGQRQ